MLFTLHIKYVVLTNKDISYHRHSDTHSLNTHSITYVFGLEFHVFHLIIVDSFQPHRHLGFLQQISMFLKKNKTQLSAFQKNESVS